MAGDLDFHGSTEEINLSNILRRPRSTTSIKERDKPVSDDSIFASKMWILAAVGVAEFSGTFVYGASLVLLPSLIRYSEVSNENSAYYQSALSIAAAMGVLLSTPIYAIFSDQIFRERYYCMISGSFFFISSIIIFLIGIWCKNITLLIVARFLRGFSVTAAWIIGMAILTEAFPKEEMSFAISVVFTVQIMAKLVAVLLSGWIADKVNLFVPFWICLALGLLDLGFRISMRLPQTVKTEDRKQNLSSVTKSFINILTNRDIILTLAVVAITTLGLNVVESYIPLWLRNNLEFNNFKISCIMLGFTIPQILLSIPIGWSSKRISGKNMVIIGLLAHTILSPLASISENTWLIIGGAICYGIARSIIRAPIFSRVSLIVRAIGEEGAYATIYAILTITSSITLIIGSYAFAYIKESFGIKWCMISVSMITTPIIPLYIFLSRNQE